MDRSCSVELDANACAFKISLCWIIGIELNFSTFICLSLFCGPLIGYSEIKESILIMSAILTEEKSECLRNGLDQSFIDS